MGTKITANNKMSEQQFKATIDVEATAPTEDVFDGDEWSRKLNMKKFPAKAKFSIEVTDGEILVRGTVTNHREEYDLDVTSTEVWTKKLKLPKKVIPETIRCSIQEHFLMLTGSKVSNKKVVPVVIQAPAPTSNPTIVVESMQRETDEQQKPTVGSAPPSK